jgi:hypothetical protein
MLKLHAVPHMAHLPLDFFQQDGIPPQRRENFWTKFFHDDGFGWMDEFHGFLTPSI